MCWFKYELVLCCKDNKQGLASEKGNFKNLKCVCKCLVRNGDHEEFGSSSPCKALWNNRWPEGEKIVPYNRVCKKR